MTRISAMGARRLLCAVLAGCACLAGVVWPSTGAWAWESEPNDTMATASVVPWARSTMTLQLRFRQREMSTGIASTPRPRVSGRPSW